MINRDGSRISLWQDHIDPYRTNNSADPGAVYDVIIAGGGITGITTALLLQRAGMKCLVLEANNLCFGTTGGTTAHLNTLLDTPYTTIGKNFDQETARLVAQAAKESIDLVQRNINLYDINCGFEETDGYLYAGDEKQEKELEDIRKASEEAGLIIGYTDQIPVPFSFRKAVQVKGQAKFSPLPYVYALAKAFEKSGGVVMQHSRVVDLEPGETIAVNTEKEVYRSRYFIYATHIPPGINLLHLRCVPYRSYAMAITLNDNKYPEGLTYDMEDPYHYYRSQVVNGQNYLIAGGKDHKTAHEENTKYKFVQLRSHIKDHFKFERIDYKWSSQYFEPADGLPYIGHLPGQPDNIFVATGFGGNGMTYSGVAAITLKEILLNENTRYSAIFNPNRVKPVAGFTNFIKHNADVVKQFAGKWFSHEELPELADLAPGEARVVMFENKKLAIFKSNEGGIHAVSPICTHMKCEVKWNEAEKTWDCPCHGARYSYDGKVVTGPASADLEQVDIRSLITK